MSKIFSERIDDVMTILNYDFATNPSDVCSDLVIEVDDKGVITEYFAHRFVISRRSPALRSIISSLPLPKEPGGQWRLPIIGHTTPSVLKLLKFIYTGEASIEIPLTSNKKGALGEAWELYRLAEQFEIESLSTFCESVMRKSIGKPGDLKDEKDKDQDLGKKEGEDGEDDVCESPSAAHRAKFRESLLNVISPSDSEAEACRDATNAAARQLIAADLNAFLGRNPNGTFIGWIASLHPENVHLDSRMWIEGNDWLVVWRDAVVNGLAQEKVKKVVPVFDWRKDEELQRLEPLAEEGGSASGEMSIFPLEDNDRSMATNDRDDGGGGGGLVNTTTSQNEGIKAVKGGEGKASIWTSWFTGGGGQGGRATSNMQNGNNAVEVAAALLARRAMEEGESGVKRGFSDSGSGAEEALDPIVEEALESYTAAISDHNSLASVAQAAAFKESNRRVTIENAVLDIVCELKRLKPTLAPLEDAKLKLRNVLQEIDDMHKTKEGKNTTAQDDSSKGGGMRLANSNQSGESSLHSPNSQNSSMMDVSFNHMVESPHDPYSPAVAYDTLSLSDEEEHMEMMMKQHQLLLQQQQEESMDDDSGRSLVVDEMNEDGVMVKGVLNSSAMMMNSMLSPQSKSSSESLAAALKLAEDTEISEEIIKNQKIVREEQQQEEIANQSISVKQNNKTNSETPLITTEKENSDQCTSKDGSGGGRDDVSTADESSQHQEDDAVIEMKAAHAMEEVRRLTEELYEEMLRHHDLEVSLETLDRERIRLLVNAETRTREVMHSKEFVASRFLLVEKRSRQAQNSIMPLSSQLITGKQVNKFEENNDELLESNKEWGKEILTPVTSDVNEEKGKEVLSEEAIIEKLMARLDKLEVSYQKEEDKLEALHEKFNEVNIEVQDIVIVDEKEEKRIISNWWVMRSAADAALGRNGAPRNDERAVELLTVAADAGCVHAQVILGLRHELGCGVKKDTSTAAKWYSLGCGDLVSEDSGDTFAMIKLAAIMTRSLDREVCMQEKSCPKGKAEDVFHNSNYERTEQEVETVKRALLTAKLWSIAAGRGHPEAIYRLAMNYETGQWKFTEQDLNNMMPPLPKCAEQFQPVKNEELAVELLTRAADYSHARAAKRLAHIYKTGLGSVKKDDKLAEKYLGMISDHLLKGKNLGSRSTSLANLLSSASSSASSSATSSINSSMVSSPASSFTEGRGGGLFSGMLGNNNNNTINNAPSSLINLPSSSTTTPSTSTTGAGGSSSLSSTFQPMFRISKSLSRVSSGSGGGSDEANKRKSHSNAGKVDEVEEEEEEDENWAIAAAVASVSTPIRDSVSVQRASETVPTNSSSTTMTPTAPISSEVASAGVAEEGGGGDKFLGSSLLKNFWGRGSAKKQPPPPPQTAVASPTAVSNTSSISSSDPTLADTTVVLTDQTVVGATSPSSSSLSSSLKTDQKKGGVDKDNKDDQPKNKEFSKEGGGVSV